MDVLACSTCNHSYLAQLVTIHTAQLHTIHIMMQFQIEHLEYAFFNVLQGVNGNVNQLLYLL